MFPFMGRLLFCVFFTSMLAACASTRMLSSNALEAPATRLLAFQERTATSSGTLIVIRDSGFVGGGCYKSFWINGRLAARFDVGEKARFFVEPGELVLRVGWDPQGVGLCSNSQDQYTDRETTLHPAEVKSFRIFTDSNAVLDIMRDDTK